MGSIRPHKINKNKYMWSNFFSKKQPNTFNYKRDLTSDALSETVFLSDPIYNIPLKRICYRGDSRPPYTKNNNGIFQVGFGNKLGNPDYAQIVKYELECRGELNRVKSNFETNHATTNAFSCQIEAAALFPLFVFTKDFLLVLQEKLSQHNFKINVIDEYSNFRSDEGYLCARDFGKIFKPSVKFNVISFLKSKNIPNVYELLGETINFINNRSTWIYIVYVEKGFDVTTHGILRSIQKNDYGNYGKLFVQEVCSDKIPANHVLAAFKITRDLNITNPSEIRKNEKFLIDDVCFNDTALGYIKTHYNNIDVDKYKKLLINFMFRNQTAGGTRIHSPVDGFHMTGPRYS